MPKVRYVTPKDIINNWNEEVARQLRYLIIRNEFSDIDYGKALIDNVIKELGTLTACALTEGQEKNILKCLETLPRSLIEYFWVAWVKDPTEEQARVWHATPRRAWLITAAVIDNPHTLLCELIEAKDRGEDIMSDEPCK